MEFSNDEDRKIYLSPKAALRIFSEQLKNLVETLTDSSESMVNLPELLLFHKKHYGYQMAPQSLGFEDMLECIQALPYIELVPMQGYLYVKCHHDDQVFRQKSYGACRIIMDAEHEMLPLNSFIEKFAARFGEVLPEHAVESMKHAIEVR